MFTDKVLQLLEEGFKISLEGKEIVISKSFSPYGDNTDKDLELFNDEEDGELIYGMRLGKINKEYADIFIQCRTKNGEVGTFIGKNKQEPISPVFDNYLQLHKWLKENGWEKSNFDENGTCLFPNICVIKKSFS